MEDAGSGQGKNQEWRTAEAWYDKHPAAAERAGRKKTATRRKETTTVREDEGSAPLCRETVPVPQGLPVTYLLIREDGGDRALFGTPCPVYFSILLRQGEDLCRLPDVAREAREARRFFRALVRGRVTPFTAPEVAEEWLARG